MRSPTAMLLVFGVVFALSAGCRPSYPNCKQDSHCSERGEVCVEGVCKECGSDEDCNEGYACEAGACVELPECSADRPCPEGQSCEAGSCVALPEDDSCEVDADCDSGEACINSVCAAAPSGAAGGPRLDDCTLERVHFAFDDFALDEESREILQQNAECIQHRSLQVTIEGHCDERGTDEYNLILGERRASSVKRYLVGLGVPDNRLGTVSYGEERPLDPRSNEAAWAKNRRAEFVVR